MRGIEEAVRDLARKVHCEQVVMARASGMEQDIEMAAGNMRDALEILRRDSCREDIGVFNGFPEGCCEYASAFLGRYLLREQICTRSQIDLPVANSENSKGWCHAWLRIDNALHVDITADQFPSGFQPVIVSRESAFHAGFEIADWEPFDVVETLVFETLKIERPYLSTVWESISATLPKICNVKNEKLNP